MKAIWNDSIIAESDDTVVVEGNHYFPLDAVNQSFLKPSDKTTYCSWKGTASYYSIVVDGEVNADAAWYYANPKQAAKQIANRVAFWRGGEGWSRTVPLKTDNTPDWASASAWSGPLALSALRFVASASHETKVRETMATTGG